MTMNEPDRTSTESSGGNFLFGYRGRIGRAQYWIGMAVIVGMLLGLLSAAAFFMDPRGGSGLFIPITILLLILIPWVHSAITIKRLRDAGLSGRSYLIFGGGILLWVLLTAELVTVLSLLLPLGLLALLAIPGLLPAENEPQNALGEFVRKIDGALQGRGQGAA
jgi:uncharacterized membrane protein YhaH (DUF805 family)